MVEQSPKNNQVPEGISIEEQTKVINALGSKEQGDLSRYKSLLGERMNSGPVVHFGSTTLLAAGLAFIVLALFVGWVGSTLHQSEVRFKNWNQANGTVISSTVARKTDDRLSSGPNSLPKQTYWILDIHYQYTVNGHDYFGSRYSNSHELIPTGRDTNPPPKILEVLRRYEEGKKVQVFYDTINPQNSYLELHLNGSRKFFVASVLSFIIGLFCLIVMFRRNG